MFKPANHILIIAFVNGTSFECDRELFLREMTADEVVKFAEDPADVARVVIIDPKPVGKINNAIEDKTKEFLDAWLEDLDVIDHDERFGCPHAIDARTWAQMLKEAEDEAADHRAMMRNPMAYHFGPNWAGIKGYR